MLAAGHSHLAMTEFGVLLSWRSACLSCLGNMHQGSREPHKCHVTTELLGRGGGGPCQKRKTDKTPPVLEMPCCIKLCLCSCADVSADAITLNTLVL